MSNKVPQIRFNGYSDDWEQRKLGEMAKEFKSGISLKAEYIYKFGKYPVYGGNGVRGYTNTYNHDGDFALIGRQGALSGNMNFSVGKAYFTEHAVAVKANDKNDTKFLFYLMTKLKLGKWVTQSAQPGLAVGTVVSIKVLVPNKNEQIKIANLFNDIDSTIALHQRKLDLLKEQKKGYLQKMFPKNGAKVPELRFEGFAEDWEERKLRDLLNKNSEKNKNLSVINVESVSNKTGFTKQTDQFEDYSVASADLSNYYVIREKQFAYNPSRINVGSIAYKDLGDEISVVSPLYVSFSTKKVLNDGFLWNWFKTASFDAQRQRLSEGGVRDTLSFNQLSEMNTMFPTYPEQEKIGSFFQQLDETIALHQRKLDLLKEQKKGYLQKMFPKNGAKVPELRFAGFADDWEERKLGEFSDVRDGTHASPKYVSQGHPMVTSKNLTHSGLDMTDVSFLTDEDFNEINKRSKVSIGDILFGMIGTIGNPVIVDRDDFAIKNVALIKEKTSNPITNKWLLQYLKSPSFNRFIQKENAGGTQKFIALGLIRDMKLRVPEFDEQQKIGAFFKKIDDTIALHQRKLDLLKEQKKGFLQKMFV